MSRAVSLQRCIPSVSPAAECITGIAAAGFPFPSGAEGIGKCKKPQYDLLVENLLIIISFFLSFFLSFYFQLPIWPKGRWMPKNLVKE
jgi:hypothetical protein